MSLFSIWKYYEKLPNTKLAKCLLCFKEYSYRTTTTNLIQHLNYKHGKVYKEYLKHRGKRVRSEWSDSDGIDNTETKHDSDDETAMKFSSELRRHFDQEDDEARCSICKETMNNSIDVMKNHLEEHHSETLDQVVEKAQKGLDADSEDNEDDMYTEVVYLEDESKRKAVPRKRKRYSKPTVKRKRKLSEFSSDYKIRPEKPQKPEKPQDELDLFTNYIRCLLQKVSQDVSPRLQLDIINLIMNAQMPQSNIVVGGNSSSNLLLKNIGTQNGGVPSGSSRVVTVPIQSLSQNNEKLLAIPVSLDHNFISNGNSDIVTISSHTMPVTSSSCDQSEL